MRNTRRRRVTGASTAAITVVTAKTAASTRRTAASTGRRSRRMGRGSTSRIRRYVSAVADAVEE